MIWNVIRVGFFLGIRQIRHANIWTTLLIIFVMTLTFLNLIVVNGILVGLSIGSSLAYKAQYSGDVLVSRLPNRQYIEESHLIENVVRKMPEVKQVAVRYVAGGRIEANYEDIKKPGVLPDAVGADIAGINPSDEDAVTNLSQRLIAGSYLTDQDEDAVLVGSGLLSQYSTVASPGFESVSNVQVGSKIRIIVAGHTREVTVKGVVKSKVSQVQRRVYFTDNEFRQILGRTDYNADEIAIELHDTTTALRVRDVLRASQQIPTALIQTSQESQGSFLENITSTFRILGSVIGGIGLAVSSITIFIVIFVNAITRRRFIGILKGIGIQRSAILLSYMFQAFFYVVVGAIIGMGILYGVLAPYFSLNPIDFPFSDGILFLEQQTIIIQIVFLISATVIAGFVPAYIVIRGNTLDAILGR